MKSSAFMWLLRDWSGTVFSSQGDELLLTNRWFHLLVVTLLDRFEQIAVKISFDHLSLPNFAVSLRCWLLLLPMDHVRFAVKSDSSP